MCGHVYVTAASRSLNIRRGARRSSLLLLMRYLMMRGENHWLASHRQHVRNVARVSLSLSALRGLSLSSRVCLVPATIPRCTSSSPFSQRRHVPHALRFPRFPRSTGDRWRTDRSITDTLDSIVAHREIFCHRFVVATAPSCPFLETRSLSLPTFLSGWSSLPPPIRSGPDWSHLASPA